MEDENTPYFREYQPPTIIERIEMIVEHSKESNMQPELFTKAETHIQHLVQAFQLTPVQVVLFSVCMDNYYRHNISYNHLADHLFSNKSSVRILRYIGDLDVLEERQLIRCHIHDLTYRVPKEVLNAITTNKVYTPRNLKNISIEEVFAYMEELFHRSERSEITTEALSIELITLNLENMHLSFFQQIEYLQKNRALDFSDILSLLYICHRLINHTDDSISIEELDDLYDDSFEFRNVKSGLLKGNHPLLVEKILENVNDGIADRDHFHLTDKAKNELLMEIYIASKPSKRDLILANDINPKSLFYNPVEQTQVQKLQDLLHPNNFQQVSQRLRDKGLRNGFACLFYGGPGTGKTETVYQLAKSTGRDILMVNIADTKSCWYGESEKLIKEVFDKYRTAVKNSEITPILLFNEADAIIGKRLENTQHSVDQTANAIQNIILQEMENLDGIMIATTNLTQNLDKAFERRFLYKIEFSKPSIQAKAAIWKSMLPDLPQEEAEDLATHYDLSGGQIENISRKYTVDSIIHGKEPSIEDLYSYCENEQLYKSPKCRSIGYKMSG